MGIKGLRKIIEKHAPGAVRSGVKLATLTGSVFVFDASLRIFKWSLVKNARAAEDGRPLNHIFGVFALTDCLRAARIRSVYVFDGAPPDEKAAVIRARTDARERGASKSPDPRVWEETRHLLDLLGVSHTTAEGEADPYVAAATHAGAAAAAAADQPDAVVYAVTDDLDALAFGAERVVLDIDCIHKTATIITLADVLREMAITHAQFIDICILLGCDYTTSTVKGLGPVKSYTLLKAYGNIETLLLGEGITPDAGFTWGAARAVFAMRPHIPAGMLTAGDAGIPNGGELRAWLTDNCGTLNKRMQAVLARIRA